jgi:hypothetical protein
MQRVDFIGVRFPTATKLPMRPIDICVHLFWRLARALFDMCSSDLGDNEPRENTREYFFLLSQSMFLQITDHAENCYMFEPYRGKPVSRHSFI